MTTSTLLGVDPGRSGRVRAKPATGGSCPLVHRAAVPQAHIRALGFGDCVELASSPSCARLVFELPARSSAERARAVRAAAEANGWTVTHSDDTPVGWNLFLRRSGFTAFAAFWRPGVYNLRCDGPKPKDECFNTINLERSG